MKHVTRLKAFSSVHRFIGELRGRRHLKKNAFLWHGLLPILQRSASVGCTFFELDALYHEITRQRPKRVLELGSGISTIVMGFAAHSLLAEGEKCTVVSMEQHESYYNDLRKLVPAEISSFIELIHSPVENQESYLGQYTIGRYTAKPQHAYDLVFIDGPQNVESRKDVNYLDGDILEVLEWNPKAFTAFLDGRLGTLKNLQQLLPWATFDYNPYHKFTRIRIPAAEKRR